MDIPCSFYCGVFYVDNFIKIYLVGKICRSTFVEQNKIIMQQQKEKIVEALKNVQTLIQELENYVEPSNQNSRNWIKELIIRTENIGNELFRINQN